MEQFRQIGEVVGSLKALMVFQDEIQINRHQCGFLLEILTMAYESIAQEMKQNLIFKEKQTKWKAMEQPLKDLHKIFKEIDIYIRQSLEPKDKWVQAITFYHNKSLMEFHIHNLLSCIPVVIEAIEMTGESSGSDPDEIEKKRALYAMKYQKDYQDPKVFQWRFGKEYLVTQDVIKQMNSVWEEDRWSLLDKITNRKSFDQQLSDAFSSDKLIPSSVLLNSKDYRSKRRLGSEKEYKEIQWRGGSFLMRQFHGDIEEVKPEISKNPSMSHPNLMQFFCGFVDNQRNEFFLVTELMARDLSTHIKEFSGTKKRFPALVDLMLQIARGMEYLHAKNVFHGRLNPSNIFVKPRNVSTDGYLHAKVAGFGLSSSIGQNQTDAQSFIWNAPEVLEEEEEELSRKFRKSRVTEKADVYSFGMICFQLLTGKVPFEDIHLQGDKMSRNIRAGERPLFPFQSQIPKYLINFTRRCWHADPDQRPSFSSICRILRYVKRFWLLNPDQNSPDSPFPTPTVDYFETESTLLKKFPSWGDDNAFPLSQIPFQMFAYKVVEKERLRKTTESISEDVDDLISERKSEGSSSSRRSDASDLFLERKNFVAPESASRRSSMTPKNLTQMEDGSSKRKAVSLETSRRSIDAKVKKQAVAPNGRSKPPAFMSSR